MKIHLLANLLVLLLFLPFAYGQESSLIVKEQERLTETSAVPSLIKVANSNTTNYNDWKRGMQQRKRKEFLTGTTAGLIGGILIGSYINVLANGTCKGIETIINPILGTTESTCPTKVTRGATIGGGIGLLVGLAVGQTNAQKIDFVPNR